MMTVDQLKADSLQRWDMDCHDCNKSFVAQLDHRINGNHIVYCPWCGHQHCRVIKDGVITSERWDGRYERIDVAKHSTWRKANTPIISNTAAQFMRDRWLNKGG